MNAHNWFCVENITGALREMRETGVACIPSLLRPSLREALVQEVIAGPFEHAEQTIGSVTQVFDRYAFLFRVLNMPFLESLRCATEALIQQNGLANWQAKDVVVQKYGTQGRLSGHRDLKRHPDVIVIHNVLGSTLFELLDDRNGRTLKLIQPFPGDCILLRGSGSAEMLDERPFHRVGGSLSASPRVSITCRDNTAPDTPIPGFSYRNTSL